MIWVRGSTRDPPPSDRRTWPRSARDGGQHRVDGSVGKGHVCVFAGECGKCFGLKKECARKGTKVNVLAFDRNMQRSKSVRKHFGGGNALEVGDLRLVENGSERGGALGADVVASETASKE